VLGNSATREIKAASFGKASAMAARKRSGANRLFTNVTNVAHSAVLSKGGGPVSQAGSSVCGMLPRLPANNHRPPKAGMFRVPRFSFNFTISKT
jgi:hypothetical protein